jgi:hypothetical protein
MPCRWFLAVSGVSNTCVAFIAGKKCSIPPAQGSACDQRPTSVPLNANRAHKATVLDKTAPLGGFSAAFCTCCGALVRFVHLPFRLKSAFVGQT